MTIGHWSLTNMNHLSMLLNLTNLKSLIGDRKLQKIDERLPNISKYLNSLTPFEGGAGDHDGEPEEQPQSAHQLVHQEGFLRAPSGRLPLAR